MAIGSTKRRSGLIIPIAWEEEFRRDHSIDHKEQERLYQKLRLSLDKRNKTRRELASSGEETQSGRGLERSG